MLEAMFESVEVTTCAARVWAGKFTRLCSLVLLAACAISLLGPAPARATTATTIGILGFTSPSVFGQSVNFVAVVGPTGATGTVSFFDGANLIGTSPVDAGTGVASFNISTLAVGPHGISAVYSGDANFSAGTSSTLSQTVNQAFTNTVVTNTPNPSVFGQPVTITATVTPTGAGAGTPTGLVTFLFDGSSIGTANLSQGVATFTTSAMAIGDHGIQATYAGDTNFHGSFNGGPDQVINKAGTTTAVVSSANPVTIGNPVTFTATVSPVAPGTGTPTGTVTFKDGIHPLGVATLSGGVATLTLTFVLTGSTAVTTTYTGDSNFNGSAGSLTGNPQVVSPAGTNTALVSLPSPSTFNQAVTFTATVTEAGGPHTPTGTVTFKDGSTTLNTVNLVAGVAALTTSTLTPGSHSITATYNVSRISPAPTQA